MRNRYKRVIVTAEIVLEFCTQGHKWGDGEILECIEGVPEGCKIIDIYGDAFLPRCIVLVLEHESFEPVKEGLHPPTFIPTLQRTVTRE